MSDLTILYYTSNSMPEFVLENFRNELMSVVGDDYPIVSVTQKPTSLGKNICVGDIGQSYYNLRLQVHAGLKEVNTEYVALVEDDSLYNKEHFRHRPKNKDAFSYNKNIWFLDRDTFWTKDHVGGFTSISTHKKMFEYVSKFLKMYPEEPLPREKYKRLVVEPGVRDEKQVGKDQDIEFFLTKDPLITLCHWDSTCGWPKKMEKTSTSSDNLPSWGNAKKLRDKLTKR